MPMRSAAPQHHMEPRRQPDNIPSPGYPSLHLLHTTAVWVALSSEQTPISLYKNKSGRWVLRAEDR